MTFMVNAASSTVRTIGPGWSKHHERGVSPARLTRPYVGFSPTIPHNAAGMRTLPPVSLPMVM